MLRFPGIQDINNLAEIEGGKEEGKEKTSEVKGSSDTAVALDPIWSLSKRLLPLQQLSCLRKFVLPLQPKPPLHQGCDKMPRRASEDWGASGQMVSWEPAWILQRVLLTALFLPIVGRLFSLLNN